MFTQGISRAEINFPKFYHNRGLIWLTYAAMSFDERALIEKLYAFREQFEQAAAMTQWPDPGQRVRELRQRGS